MPRVNSESCATCKATATVLTRVTAREDRARGPHLHGVGRRRRDAQLVRYDDDIMITSAHTYTARPSRPCSYLGEYLGD